jgi:hypothetical protein
MFVRSRKAKGSTYYAVVESYREAGKIKHRQVAALGRHQRLEDAIAAAEREVRQGRRRLARIAAVWPDSSPLPTRTARERERITQKLALQKERLRLLADVRDRMSKNRSATAPAERQDA